MVLNIPVCNACRVEGATTNTTHITNGIAGVIPSQLQGNTLYPNTVHGTVQRVIEPLRCLGGNHHIATAQQGRVRVALNAEALRHCANFAPMELLPNFRRINAVTIVAGMPSAPFNILLFDPRYGMLRYVLPMGRWVGLDRTSYVGGGTHSGTVPVRQVQYVLGGSANQSALWLDYFQHKVLLSYRGLWWEVAEPGVLKLTYLPVGYPLCRVGTLRVRPRSAGA